MSSISQGSQAAPNSQTPMGLDRVRSPESNLVVLTGSFEGNGASSPVSLQQRGNWFTVALQSTGHYRVSLTGVNPLGTYTSTLNTTQSSLGTGPGWPAGMDLEPFAWITNETVATTPYISTGNTGSGYGSYAVYIWTTKVDKTNAATLNTFDIFVYTQALGVSSVTTTAPALTNVTSNDRVNFKLWYKLTGFTP